MTINALMQHARDLQASDLILVAGASPCAYVHGQLTRLQTDPLLPHKLNDMTHAFLKEKDLRTLQDTGDVDLCRGAAGIGRARINVHKQRSSYAVAIRFISGCIPSFDELHLPSKLIEFAQLPRGLVLVTGATGSGKSTTLAAMIQYMNDHFERHIITLEDPIEYLFAHNRCIIEQRDIGEDTPSFAQALKHILRQKPDAILVGEMRDHETIATALTAAETGHLILGTLHTNSAAQTVERVIDVFDSAHQPQIRVQLAGTLQGVVCQTLLPRQADSGMVPAVEIMAMTPAIRRAIRDNETHLIPSMIETGQKLGMRTLDQSLAQLVRDQFVSSSAALAQSRDPDKLARVLGVSPESRTEITANLAEANTSHANPLLATSWPK